MHNKVHKVIPLFAIKAGEGGDGVTSPLILNLYTGWKWMVSLMPQLLYR